MEWTAGFKGKERPNLAKFMRRSNRLNAAQHGRSIFYNAFVKTTTTQGAEQEMAFEEEYHDNEYVNRNTKFLLCVFFTNCLKTGTFCLLYDTNNSFCTWCNIFLGVFCVKFQSSSPIFIGVRSF